MSHLKSLFSILVHAVLLPFQGIRRANLLSPSPHLLGLGVVALLTACGGGVDDPLGSVRLSLPSGQTTTEAGGTLEVEVSLTIAPTTTVTLELTSSDTGEGTVSPATLTFTPDTWETPQTVTVTGVDDDFDDGDVVYTISATVRSDDTNFNALSVIPIELTNIDDDPRIALAASTGMITTESGGTVTIDVSLSINPTTTVTP